MGTLPFPPKKTGHHNRPAHLAVEAIRNGESGGFFCSRMEAMVSSLKRLFIVSITVFANKNKKQPLHMFRLNGTSAESFGNWERILSPVALAKWEI